MGKFLISLALVLGTTYARAFEVFNGTTNLKQFNKIKCENSVGCSRSGDKLVLGLSGSLQPQVAATATGSITSSQCGSTFVASNGAGIVLTLPEASTVLGCRILVICATVNDVDLNPADTTDVIGITGSITGANTTTVLAPAAGDAIRCTDIGASYMVEAVAADLWAVLRTNGIITDVN